ncbi:6-phosphogluconolactonase [Halpernia sp.]|uniref:6-phosphogluconolactonase n=1 Tax=Halpernia sp. TaxID=2782209 RepID=UPI003A8F3182
MEIKIYKEINELISAVADLIVKISAESIAEKDRFDFVLSGGSSPRKLYELLASEKYKNKIDWSKTYFFFGDERFVPKGDSQRNSLMAKETLFNPLEINASNIFLVDTSKSPEESAKMYAKTIEKYFNGKKIIFDFNLLGLGDNSHTASLFPFTSVLSETEATIKSVFVKELDAYRITMTAPLINQSKNIAFLVFGENKAKAVFNVLKSKGSSAEFPAKLISSENLTWFLDAKASDLLKIGK